MYEIIDSLLKNADIMSERFCHDSAIGHYVWHIPTDRSWEERKAKSFSIALIKGRVEVWKWNEEHPVSYGSDFEAAVDAVKAVVHKETIAVFDKDTEERKTLEKAAEMLTKLSPNGFRYYVGETYFDFGQKWMWTTILCDSGSTWGSWQALNPREQDEIIFSGSDNILKSAVHKVLKDSLLDKKEA